MSQQCWQKAGTNARTAMENPIINQSTEDPFAVQREGDDPFAGNKGVGQSLEDTAVKEGSLSPPNSPPARERRMSKEWGTLPLKDPSHSISDH
jgi:hypothetical protein